MQQRDADAGSSLFFKYIVDTYDHGIQAAGLQAKKYAVYWGRVMKFHGGLKTYFFFVNMSNGKCTKALRTASSNAIEAECVRG